MINSDSSLKNFTDINVYNINQRGYKPKNNIFTARESNSENTWFLKDIIYYSEIDSLYEGVIEVAVSHLYRVFIGGHYPKAIFIHEWDEFNNCTRYIVATEAVSGFKEFILNIPNKDLNFLMKLKDFSAIPVYAMFFEENDLSPFNIGIQENNVIKIDHGSCLTSIRPNVRKFNTCVMKDDIDNVFIPIKYKPESWLNLIVNGEKITNEKVEILYKEYGKVSYKEKFNAVLKILILPESYLRNILTRSIDKNYSKIIQEIYGKLIERRHQLLDEVIKINLFREYILTENLYEVITEFTESIANYFDKNQSTNIKICLEKELKELKELQNYITNSLYRFITNQINSIDKRTFFFKSKVTESRELYENTLLKKVENETEWTLTRKQTFIFLNMLTVFNKRRLPKFPLSETDTTRSYCEMLKFMFDFLSHISDENNNDNFEKLKNILANIRKNKGEITDGSSIEKIIEEISFRY